MLDVHSIALDEIEPQLSLVHAGVGAVYPLDALAQNDIRLLVIAAQRALDWVQLSARSLAHKPTTVQRWNARP